MGFAWFGRFLHFRVALELLASVWIPKRSSFSVGYSFFAFALAFGSLGRRIPLKRIRIRPLEVVGVLMFAWKAFGILIPTLRTLRVFSVLGYPAKN